MVTPASSPAKILIVTDVTSDASLVKKLLDSEFEHVFTSTESDKFAGDFVRYQPDVLVMAFNTLEKSERYYLGLHRLCPEVHLYPHRTVILCSQDEMRRAYDLCKKDYFDDYILFWPMTHDTLRLPMSIHCALRELVAHKPDGPSAAEFAVQARRLAELENLLDQQILRGGQHIEAASKAMNRAEEKVDASMDRFSQRLINGELSDSVSIINADGLRKVINHIKQDEIQQHFRSAAESTQPLKQWANKLKKECAPLLDSARALGTMAESIRPTVLVVDDDEFQRDIIGRLLKTEKYHLIFATDGVNALSILGKTRPDLILMDISMPDMDGIETTRRLKAVPQFAKTPVIMVTGDSEGDVVINSLKAGASDFVVKPFNSATLVAKISRALSAAASS